MTSTTSIETLQEGPAAQSAALRVAVIAASVRTDRLSLALAAWAAARASAAGAAVDLIDLGEIELPDDSLLEPGGGPRSVIADRVAQADAYVLVTPEYNHSYPASLKRAIDWHYTEWMFKAATVLPYGVQGGILAAEHLRAVLAELHVVTTRRCVALRQPWNDVDDQRYLPADGVEPAFDQALTELLWWGETLRTARRERPFAP